MCGKRRASCGVCGVGFAHQIRGPPTGARPAAVVKPKPEVLLPEDSDEEQQEDDEAPWPCV